MSICAEITAGAIPVAKSAAIRYGARHGGQARLGRGLQVLRAICRKAGIGENWTPRELRHTFVSLLSGNGMAIEDISRLVGHSSTLVTQTVYRHELRPVVTSGAEMMDRIFADGAQ